MTHTIQFRPGASSSVDLDDDRHEVARTGDLPCAIRKLGSVEHFLWLLNQHRPMHFAVAAHVSGRTDVAAWRNALDHLQRRHSLMSVAIVSEPGRVPYFQQRSAVRIPLRVIHDNPAARWEDEVVAELANPFGAADVPLIRAVLIHADQNAALILVAHHAIADGMSLAYIAVVSQAIEQRSRHLGVGEALGHSPKATLVVTMVEVRSQSRLMR
jgi:hypothetical protein